MIDCHLRKENEEIQSEHFVPPEGKRRVKGKDDWINHITHYFHKEKMKEMKPSFILQGSWFYKDKAVQTNSMHKKKSMKSYFPMETFLVEPIPNERFVMYVTEMKMFFKSNLSHFSYVAQGVCLLSTGKCLIL